MKVVSWLQFTRLQKKGGGCDLYLRNPRICDYIVLFSQLLKKTIKPSSRLLDDSRPSEFGSYEKRFPLAHLEINLGEDFFFSDVTASYSTPTSVDGRPTSKSHFQINVDFDRPSHDPRPSEFGVLFWAVQGEKFTIFECFGITNTIFYYLARCLLEK